MQALAVVLAAVLAAVRVVVRVVAPVVVAVAVGVVAVEVVEASLFGVGRRGGEGIHSPRVAQRELER